MDRLSEEKILSNKTTTETLIKAQHEQIRAPMQRLFADLGDEYFTAPASGQERYHGAFPGGLCDHSLRVATNLYSIAGALLPDAYEKRTLAFLGIVHDLGKVGDKDQPYYVPNPNEYGRKRGFIYEINRDLPYMAVCDRTIYLLQKYGVPLTQEEYIAIRISDGPYEKCNEKYGMQEPDLALLLHFADRWACAQEKAP
jgi:hypothetical protein